MNFRILVQNCFLIPVKPNFPNCFDLNTHQRAARLCQMIDSLNQGDEPVDLLVLQEVWSERASWISRIVDFILCGSAFARRIVENHIRDSFRFFTELKGKPGMRSQRLLDSGLMIASRHPILDQAFFAFGKGSDAVEALANKGALAAAILTFSGKLVIVCNTHLDAGHSARVRFEQLSLIIPFITSFRENASLKTGRQVAMTLFCGDFNTDGLSPSLYHELCTMIEPLGLRDSWLGSEPCVTSEGCGDESQRLDYIFSDRPALFTDRTPPFTWRVDKKSREELIRAKSEGRDVSNLVREIDSRRRSQLMSDHAGLIATFRL